MAFLNIFSAKGGSASGGKKKEGSTNAEAAKAVVTSRTPDAHAASAQSKTMAHDPRYTDILARPLVTEKGTRQNTMNQYAFVVELGANKIEVMKAVHAVYGVKPLKVNIARVRGKNVRYGRTQGTTKAWKKAIVTLPKGKTIQIYEGV